VAGAAPVPQNDWGQWVESVTQPLSHNPENWGLRDIELPLITLEKLAGASPQEILAATRRERMIDRLFTRLKAKAWRTITPLLRAIDKRS
jgi:hypothetical protein